MRPAVYPAGTLDVVARLWAQHPTTSAVQAASIPAFTPRGGDYENGTARVPGRRHRADPGRFDGERAATGRASAATAAVRLPDHPRASEEGDGGRGGRGKEEQLERRHGGAGFGR